MAMEAMKIGMRAIEDSCESEDYGIMTLPGQSLDLKAILPGNGCQPCIWWLKS